MGVRKGDRALKAKLDDIIIQKRSQIAALLQSYGIPTVPMTVEATQNARPANSEK